MKSWSRESVSATKVKNLVKKYNIDPITASILIRRKLDTPENLKYFLVRNEVVLNSPFCFKEMHKFVERIKTAINKKEKVYLFGDRDTDGVTSLTIMSEWLDAHGIEHVLRLPVGDENYGLSISCVDEAVKEGCSLVITVDCGITAIESVEAFNKAGIDVLITDHHLPPDSSKGFPASYSTIDPKCENSGYPFDGLSGAGVVAKCIYALEFSLTQHYNSNYYLTTVEYGKTGATIILSFMKVRNMVEEERIIEEWVADGNNSINDSKILKELLDKKEKIFTYNKEEYFEILSMAFKGLHDIEGITALENRVTVYFPNLLHKGLRYASEIIMYHKVLPHGNALLDTFYYLFFNCISQSLPHLKNITRSCLDLSAISTVADLMPLTGENHTLVKMGLDVINSSPRPSLRPFLAQKALVMKEISAMDISFYISPVINSAGRMGESNVAINMLLARTSDKVDLLSRQLFALNDERRHIGDEAWKVIYSLATESYQNSGEKFVFVHSADIPRGFTGLSASRALKTFHVPCVVIAESNDIASGSIRTPDNVNSLEFIQNFAHLLSDFGAHRCAGGFSMKRSNVEILKAEMTEYAINMFDVSSVDEDISIDVELPASLVSMDLLRINEFFAPFGAGNPQLVFYIKSLVVDRADCFELKDKLGLRLILSNGISGFSCIGWDHGDKLNRDFALGDKVDIIATVGKNYYKGNYSMQFTLIDIAKSEQD